ncbi:hypothetical protein DPX16_3579 [Anabarilius grahami]|uniref:Uncharacterized protein n=1 Tax=Anabarilius grahami TaxID=495550 RepID=A0A3N0XR84_ANAGA|nr:hypothetical protein DPX16_3579 [Anabarilius grahami]
MCPTIVKMEFIKEEIEDMSDPEPSRIKHEDTEEQIAQTSTAVSILFRLVCRLMFLICNRNGRSYQLGNVVGSGQAQPCPLSLIK